MIKDDVTRNFRWPALCIVIIGLVESFSANAAIPKTKSVAPPASALQTRVVADIQNEHKLYGKVLSAYQLHQHREMLNYVQLLEVSFPQSVYLDNSYYLLGLSFLNRQMHSDALAWFNKVIEKTPGGNKVGASFLAKGFVYQQLGLAQQSIHNFKQVMNRYPGSPESFQASTQLEILERLNQKGARK